METDSDSFFPNLFLYLYESKWINAWINQSIKARKLIKASKLSTILNFNDDLNARNDGGWFESNYCIIYPGKSELRQENTDKHEARFLDLDINIRNGKFQNGLFDKVILIFTIYDSFFAICAESLRNGRASNNLDSFSIAKKETQGVSTEKLNRVILKILDKRQRDF